MSGRILLYIGGALCCLLCCAVAIAAVIIGLVLGGFRTVEYYEWGIPQDTILKTVDTTKIYGNGWHNIGLTKSFIIFPRMPQSIDYSVSELKVRTKDQAELQLSLSFQYIIPQKEVGTLYRKYTTPANLLSTVRREAQTAIINAVGNNYNSNDYFEKRREIADVFMTAIQQKLVSVANVTVEYLQLNEVVLPAALETRVVSKLVREQETLIANLEQQLNLIRSQTEVYLETIRRRLQTIEFDTQGTLNLLQSEAEANATVVRLESEKDTYNIIKSSLKFSNLQLLTYLFHSAAAQLKTGKMAVNLQHPLIAAEAASKSK